MKTSVGKTSIEIGFGDITEYEVDAIACPANPELSMDSGVAGALKRAGGSAIETEAMLQGPIAAGDAVVTTGQGLKAQWVIHTAAVYADRTTDAALVAKATHSALAKADSAQARTLAMPAFGTGVGGFPLYQCASIMTGETARYLRERKNSGLRRIVFVTYSDAAKAAFTNALAGIGRF